MRILFMILGALIILLGMLLSSPTDYAPVIMGFQIAIIVGLVLPEVFPYIPLPLQELEK